jgi:L-2-hydroxyglutarate oxidase
MSEANSSDYLVIGGGIIGLCIALELKTKYPTKSVTLIDKEEQCGQHASARNSGVLHAGFYYTADSLKAKFCREGNEYWTQYCLKRKLRINPCGKLVVAKDKDDLAPLAELVQRAKANGVAVQTVSEKKAQQMEPRVKTHKEALYSPSTASIDPKEIVASIKQDLLNKGVQILENTKYLGRGKKSIQTNQGILKYGFLINAAGLYAEKIAHDYKVGLDYQILPFKGLYLYSKEPAKAFKMHIYPVPDLLNPFLGVHFTLTVDGRVKLGPTAIPAFWREQYQGWDNFDLKEFKDIAGMQSQLLWGGGFDFKKLAWAELSKYAKTPMVDQAKVLAKGIEQSDYTQWGQPGIRAQLISKSQKKLIMDFVFKRKTNSMHVLNAVSPGFTCAMPFAKHICEQI